MLDISSKRTYLSIQSALGRELWSYPYGYCSGGRGRPRPEPSSHRNCRCDAHLPLGPNRGFDPDRGPTRNGGIVGDLPVSSIDPPSVDKIYDRLKSGPRGARRRQANLSIDIAGRVWDVVHRLHPKVLPAENPWRGVLQDRQKRTKAACSRAEAYALAGALMAAGEPALGAATAGIRARLRGNRRSASSQPSWSG